MTIGIVVVIVVAILVIAFICSLSSLHCARAGKSTEFTVGSISLIPKDGN